MRFSKIPGSEGIIALDFIAYLDTEHFFNFLRPMSPSGLHDCIKVSRCVTLIFSNPNYFAFFRLPACGGIYREP